MSHSVDDFSHKFQLTRKQFNRLKEQEGGTSNTPKGKNPCVFFKGYMFRMNWGQIIDSYWSLVTDKEEVEIKTQQQLNEKRITGVSFEHLTAQFFIQEYLTQHKPIIMHIGCKTCKNKEAMQDKILITVQQQRVEMEWQVGRHCYDVAVIPSDAVKGTTEAMQIIEVFKTHKTAECDRPSKVPWYEVKASDVLQHIEQLEASNDDTHVVSLHCQRIMTRECKACVVNRRLQKAKEYIQSNFVQKVPHHLQQFVFGSECLLCSDILHLRWKLCSSHKQQLKTHARNDTLVHSEFFSSAESIQQGRLKAAELGFQEQERERLETEKRIKQQEEEEEQQRQERQRLQEIRLQEIRKQLRQQQEETRKQKLLQQERQRLQLQETHQRVMREQAAREERNIKLREAHETQLLQASEALQVEREELREKRKLENLEEKAIQKKEDERIANAKRLHAEYANNNLKSGRWPKGSNRCKCLWN